VKTKHDPSWRDKILFRQAVRDLELDLAMAANDRKKVARREKRDKVIAWGSGIGMVTGGFFLIMGGPMVALWAMVAIIVVIALNFLFNL
jgi:predicted tellurium resistance membrane protein TerC